MTQMTAVSLISQPPTATAVPGIAVTVSDTIAAADIGTNGALLNVINGSGGSINVTVVDPNTTPAGNAGSAAAQAVAAGADRWFRIGPNNVNSSGVATVTYSSATTVTYKLIKL